MGLAKGAFWSYYRSVFDEGYHNAAAWARGQGLAAGLVVAIVAALVTAIVQDDFQPEVAIASAAIAVVVVGVGRLILDVVRAPALINARTTQRLDNLADLFAAAQVEGSPLQQGLGNLWKQGVQLRQRMRALADDADLRPLFDNTIEWAGMVDEMLANPSAGAPELRAEFAAMPGVPVAEDATMPTREAILDYLDRALDLMANMQTRLQVSV